MRRSFPAGLALLACVGVAGCGAEYHPNDLRPPAGVQLSGKVDDHRVVIAPSRVGGGLAQITFSNQSDDDVALEFFDPTGRPAGSVDEIAAGGVGSIQITLERGDYEIEPSVSTIDSGTLAVGPERPSAQNDLLLP